MALLTVQKRGRKGPAQASEENQISYLKQTCTKEGGSRNHQGNLRKKWVRATLTSLLFGNRESLKNEGVQEEHLYVQGLESGVGCSSISQDGTERERREKTIAISH